MPPNNKSLGRPSLLFRLRWILLLVLFVIGVLVFFVGLQRSMIYAARKGAVPLSAAGAYQRHLEVINVPTRDGISLRGWLARSDLSQAPKSERLVILFPGNAGNRSFRTGILEDFNACQSDCLICDYRGYAENSGKPSEEALAGDALDIWNFACKELKYSPEQIVLCGESLGGGVATRLAWELCLAGTPPAGLILRTTFTSLTDTAKALFPWLPVRTFLIDRYPSIDRIGEITCPILVIHGQQDRIVPYSQGEKLFEAAPPRSATGIEKTFLSLPESGHNDLQLTAAEELYEAHQKFLRQAFSELSADQPVAGE